MLIAGLATLILIWWLVKAYLKMNPAFAAKNMRRAGGVAALGAAAFLAFRGRIDMAIPLGGFGAWLLGIQGLSLPGFGSATTTPGAKSRVRSAMLEMILDHDTGALNGRVLAGPFEGRELDSLGDQELAQLASLCQQSDPDGSRLLDAYLDRRFPGRSKTAQGDADTGRGLAGRHRRRPRPRRVGEGPVGACPRRTERRGWPRCSTMRRPAA